MRNNRIRNLQTPISSSDAATKGYVDSVAGGMSCTTRTRTETTSWGFELSCNSNEELIGGWCSRGNYGQVGVRTVRCLESDGRQTTAYARCCQ